MNKKKTTDLRYIEGQPKSRWKFMDPISLTLRIGQVEQNLCITILAAFILCAMAFLTPLPMFGLPLGLSVGCFFLSVKFSERLTHMKDALLEKLGET